jgi:hypothetical protein
MVKSPAEVERIRRSVETNSRAFEQAVARLRPGVKEQDLAAELEYRMRRLGAEKPAFETIVAGGVRSALPHAQPTAAPLCAGDLVVVDMGAFVEGYASDMTRMLFLGAPGCQGEARVSGGSGGAVGCHRRGARGSRGRPRGPRRPRRAQDLRPGPRLSSTPPGTAWAWKSTNRRASAPARRPACAPGWPSPSSPAFMWKDGAASASRTRSW